MGFLNPGRRVKQGMSWMQGRARILGLAKDIKSRYGWHKGKSKSCIRRIFSGLSVNVCDFRVCRVSVCMCV